jgi:LmbE family N-acetylglucosaminyl deacetylase
MTPNCAYDQAAAAMPDEPWKFLLEGQNWSPEGMPLIVLAMHPSQETLGAGGLIAGYARRLRPVIVVSVTDGTASGGGWRGQQALRRSELKRALALLSPHMILQTRLGLVAGDVEGHEQSLRGLLRHLIRPGALLVAPYKQGANPDFSTVGRVCQEVALEHDLLLARYPVQPLRELDFDSGRHEHWARYELSAEARAAKAMALKAFKPVARPPSGEARIPRPVLYEGISPYEAFLL